MLFGWKIEEVLLIYVDKTFLKIEGSLESLKTSKIALRALFYNVQKKSWENPFVRDERLSMDLLATQREFLERQWILLKKNSVQDGPYSSKEVFELCLGAKLSLKNAIWKEGMTEWKSIGSTQTFKALEKFSDSVETDIAEILSHVMEYDPGMRRVEAENKNSSPGEPNEVFIILDDK